MKFETIVINADVNGAYNILVKCMPKAFADGVAGVVVHPARHKIDEVNFNVLH